MAKFIIHKKWGETPLEALSRLRAEEQIPADVPMTYAGRLDPAAEGLLLILTGEECKKKDTYSGFDKTYVAEIVFGVSTDSYDLLGIPKAHPISRFNLDMLKQYMEEILGKQIQNYPPYSSKSIDTGIIPPPHEVELYSYKNLSLGDVSREDVLLRVGEIAAKVTGEFRQSQIIEAWAGLDLPPKLHTLKVELEVSSGFYVRQLAEDLGRAFSSGACLYSLVRTKIEKAPDKISEAGN